MPSNSNRVLIVEDNASLSDSLTNFFSERAAEVVPARSVAAARAALSGRTFDIVLMDFSLPDGDAFDVLVALADVSPTPVIVGMSGVATPDDAFHLAQRGVRGYLKKPFDISELTELLDSAVSAPPDLTPQLRALVGHKAIRDVERDVRKVMVNEALARADGSRRGAARLLRISRQLLQHIIRNLSEELQG